MANNYGKCYVCSWAPEGGEVWVIRIHGADYDKRICFPCLNDRRVALGLLPLSYGEHKAAANGQ